MKRIWLITVGGTVLALSVAAVAQNPIPKKATEPAAHNQDGQNAQPQPPPVHPVSSPSETATQKQQSPPPEERNETIHNDNPDTDWWARFAEVIAAIATVALAIIGYFGVQAAKNTLSEIRQQTEVAKTSANAALLNAQTLVNSERPWLLLGKKMFPDRSHTWLELEIRIHNFGRTPAKVTAMQFDVRFGDSQDTPPRPEFFEKMEPFNPHVLPQGEELTYEIDATNSEGAKQYPSKHLWVSGLVRYEDTFESANPTTHETLFCGLMMLHGGRTVWKRGPDQYNKAT